ncbi:30S ribosomal protein S2 [Candidatus Giovannonibacteria bacterium RIFCSPLOWO2_02_FULL_45_14]|uniref:Small ribosomal subunit protein uS2 n=1 Tax=Candidatus Giovannonibacteria bacterium RIFCSPLOWO2_12_FULL_44_15 TaxID=1798364 RepID=A0A1F5Y0J9_9BACT|nr:MAG: 30S ribosomal protein S2 [Candidatus Giovannonibacteria bacterium RIFCSPHIGHO2_02_FULL_44_31]OGF76296.1 MAG: 30S ribosomal protein S2 [Candidatus Giovannonibacteria bacterium RIFCSPHIGHO2_12_FULL_44_29]OGF91327.1 MAG: 30S ribosomal protein S2 [Candidatus Giovannonibacteria bacterium RIFCSPLOWO2_02_FULL_45_14]OGF93677.1 MAG: 30S ribosomal protein S2 [Candidatus Giovannonibacteria bacterium RIFCSPLOWO2_12_FULL_44_15]
MAEVANEAEKLKVADKDKEFEAMFQAGVHFGYSRSHRHPSMSDFIHGVKNNVEIFDLEKTLESLEAAENFLRKIGEAKKNILWVGTKPSAKALIEKHAKALGHSYVAGRWIGGTLTNVKIIRDRIKYFEDLKKKRESKELEKYTKKERLRIAREIKTLEEKFSGIENLKGDIGAMIIVDPKEEKTAFSEARRVLLPVIAILSSDNDLSKVTNPIPSNDSASSSIEFLLERLAKAYQDGLSKANLNG